MKKPVQLATWTALLTAGLLVGCGGGDDTATTNTLPSTPATPQACSAQAVTLTYSANAAATSNPFTNGEKICFDATKTTLKFSEKTLINPTQNTAVTGDYSAYRFVDGTTALEVVFNKDVVYEINVNSAADVSKFFGQFAK